MGPGRRNYMLKIQNMNKLYIEGSMCNKPLKHPRSLKSWHEYYNYTSYMEYRLGIKIINVALKKNVWLAIQ